MMMKLDFRLFVYQGLFVTNIDCIQFSCSFNQTHTEARTYVCLVKAQCRNVKHLSGLLAWLITQLSTLHLWRPQFHKDPASVAVPVQAAL